MKCYDCFNCLLKQCEQLLVVQHSCHNRVRSLRVSDVPPNFLRLDWENLSPGKKKGPLMLCRVDAKAFLFLISPQISIPNSVAPLSHVITSS